MAAQNLRKFVNGFRLPNNSRYIKIHYPQTMSLQIYIYIQKKQIRIPKLSTKVRCVHVFFVMVVGVFFPNSLACFAALCDCKAAVQA